MKRGNHFTSLLWHLFIVWKYIAYEFCLPVKLIGLNGRRDSHEIEEPLSFLVLCSSLLLNHRVEIDGRWENMWNKLLFPWFIENHLQPKKHTFIYVPPSNQMFGSLETNQPNCFLLSRELTVWNKKNLDFGVKIVTNKTELWDNFGMVFNHCVVQKSGAKEWKFGGLENDAFESYNYQLDGVSNHPSISENLLPDCCAFWSSLAKLPKHNNEEV